jgi:cell division protein FtsZ
LHEVNEAATLIQEEAHDDANIIFGAVIDEQMGDEIRITVIATGFGDPQREVKRPGFSLNQEPVSSPARPMQTPARVNPRERDANRPVVHLGTIIDDLESPTFQRYKPGTERANGGELRPDEFTISSEENEDQYEIPAFLRKNAM